jgi:hypothetical protein
MIWDRWQQPTNINARSWTCGFCGNGVGGNKGWYYINQANQHTAFIYICSTCGRPTFFDETQNQHPGPVVGREIRKLPPDIEAVYREMRTGIKNSLWTSVILIGRKLIMHLAVDVAGGNEGETFAAYIQHLKNSGYVPPKSDKWLDYLRKSGNEKTHEVAVGTEKEALQVLSFVELLLIFMYEYADDPVKTP